MANMCWTVSFNSSLKDTRPPATPANVSKLTFNSSLKDTKFEATKIVKLGWYFQFLIKGYQGHVAKFGILKSRVFQFLIKGYNEGDFFIKGATTTFNSSLKDTNHDRKRKQF